MGQIWRYQIRWAIFMDPTAAGDNDGFFTGDRAFRTLLGIAESNATCKLCQNSFSTGRDIEVIHRCRNNDNVVGFQLGNQLIGKRQSFLLTWSQRRIARTQCTNQFTIQTGIGFAAVSRTVISSAECFRAIVQQNNRTTD